jgi:hypothetical protein
MTGRRLEPDFARDFAVGFDQVGQPGVDDGSDRVLDRVAALPVIRNGPMLPFLAPDQIARLGKGRHPASADEHRIVFHPT